MSEEWLANLETELGGRTPEIMVEYEKKEKILFSADGFGKFGALDAEDAFRYDRLVLAAPTYDGGLFPAMEDFRDCTIVEPAVTKRSAVKTADVRQLETLTAAL